MRCTNCGTENPSDMSFCQECGQPLPKPVIKSSEDLQKFKITSLVTCPACGYQNRAEVQFCEECGNPLQKVETVLSPKPEPPKPAGKTCPACGHKNQPDMSFCEECGKSLQQGKPVVKKAPTTKPPLWKRRGVRGCLVATGLLMIMVIAVAAFSALTPEVSRSEAVIASNVRIRTMYPNVGNLNPVVQTNRTDGDLTYRIEYQTTSGKIIIVVDAETGETFMMGIR